MHWRRKWQPTPVFLPGESQGRRAWWTSVYGVALSRTWLKWLSSSSSRLEWSVLERQVPTATECRCELLRLDSSLTTLDNDRDWDLGVKPSPSQFSPPWRTGGLAVAEATLGWALEPILVVSVPRTGSVGMDEHRTSRARKGLEALDSHSRHFSWCYASSE